MAKTVHPYAFRLGILRNWKSRWFNLRKYRKFLKADILIREHLIKYLRGMHVDSIEIERTPTVLTIIIKTSRPALLIGRRGEGVEKIKEEVIKLIKKIRLEISREIRLNIEEIRHPELSAKIMSQVAAESLEKRMSFRRVMKQIIDKVMANKEARGVKIMLSGRLGGNEMSRREWLKKGSLPLQTLRSDIDFARERAHLPYGDIGIKVWIYKGERFE